MRRLAAAVLCVSVIGVAVAQDAEKELKKLEGTYSVKVLTKDGESAPKEVMDAVKGVIIKDGKLTIQILDEQKIAKFKIDPAKKPAHFDLSPEAGPEKGKTFPGIYKVEKDELTIIFTEEGDRPKDFEGKGHETMKLVLTPKAADNKK